MSEHPPLDRCGSCRAIFRVLAEQYRTAPDSPLSQAQIRRSAGIGENTMRVHYRYLAQSGHLMPDGRTPMGAVLEEETQWLYWAASQPPKDLSAQVLGGVDETCRVILRVLATLADDEGRGAISAEAVAARLGVPAKNAKTHLSHISNRAVEGLWSLVDTDQELTFQLTGDIAERIDPGSFRTMAEVYANEPKRPQCVACQLLETADNPLLLIDGQWVHTRHTHDRSSEFYQGT